MYLYNEQGKWRWHAILATFSPSPLNYKQKNQRQKGSYKKEFFFINFKKNTK
jgi:TPP-dependent 2-oxoacid decarboxylase